MSKSDSHKFDIIRAFAKKLNHYCSLHKVDLLINGYLQFPSGTDYVKFHYSHFNSMSVDELDNLLSKSFADLGIKFYSEV